MVWEERFFAAPQDISSIRLTCRKCKSATTLPFGERDYIPESCAYCRERWFMTGSDDFNHVMWMFQALTSLRRRNDKALCEIHFEMPGKLNMPDNSQ